MNQSASLALVEGLEQVRIWGAPIQLGSTSGRKLSAELHFDGTIQIKIPSKAKQSDLQYIIKQIERQWRSKIERTQQLWADYWGELSHVRLWNRLIPLDRRQAHSESACITWSGERLVYSGNLDGSDYINAVAEFYRREAKSLMPSRVIDLWQQIGWHDLETPSVRVKRLRSRWGSCSTANNINLNLWLMALTEADFDHVVLHEFCHLREMNHGPKFYQWLCAIEPDWQDREKVFQQHVMGGWIPFR